MLPMWQVLVLVVVARRPCSPHGLLLHQGLVDGARSAILLPLGGGWGATATTATSPRPVHPPVPGHLQVLAGGDDVPATGHRVYGQRVAPAVAVVEEAGAVAAVEARPVTAVR